MTTTTEFIKQIESKGYTVTELQSGKLRATSPTKTTYLLSPIEAVRYGTWLNESTYLDEPLPA